MPPKPLVLFVSTNPTTSAEQGARSTAVNLRQKYLSKHLAEEVRIVIGGFFHT